MSVWRDTFLHLRPRSWPIVFAHYAAGALCVLPHVAAGQNRTGLPLGQALAGGVLWTVCLNGGTLAINSAFDNDTGDIGYLDNPPPIPKALAGFSVALMLAGLLGSWWVSPGFALAYVLCLVLSLLYSVPPIRLKAVAGADLLVNMAGYGALTLAAGAFASAPAAGLSSPLAWAVTWTSASFAFLFGAFYPMTQIYQIPEDRERGDKTLAILLGERGSLVFSLVALLLACACQLWALHLVHARPWGWSLVALAFGGWFAFTLDWLLRQGRYPAQKGMYRALKLWAVSDVAVVVVFALGLAQQ